MATQLYGDAFSIGPPCGIILLSSEAIFILHLLRSITGLFTPVEQVPELQQILHAKG